MVLFAFQFPTCEVSNFVVSTVESEISKKKTVTLISNKRHLFSLLNPKRISKGV